MFYSILAFWINQEGKVEQADGLEILNVSGVFCLSFKKKRKKGEELECETLEAPRLLNFEDGQSLLVID